MLPGFADIGLFRQSARTDAAIAAARVTAGMVAGGDPAAPFEAAYTRSADPWASADARYGYQARKYRTVLKLLPDRAYGDALDLGSGLGLLTQGLALRAHRVLGIEIAPAAVALARARARAIPNVRFEVGSVLALPPALDGRFDLVTVADTFYYLPEVSRGVLAPLAARVAALLRPGGVLALADHFFAGLDADSRRSALIHRVFAAEPALRLERTHWRPFYRVSVLALRG